MDLITAFESVCASNGDDVAFYLSGHRHHDNSNDEDDDENNKTDKINSHPKLLTVGFTELNENVNLIINELYYRHDVQSSPQPPPPNNNNHKSLFLNFTPIIIVSSHPSPGEAAAVLACTKRQIPFVPLPIHGPHRISPIRITSIIAEVNPVAAMVVLSPPLVSHDNDDDDDDDDDYDQRPALSPPSIAHYYDTHPTILTLQRYNIHRIIIINSHDGSVIAPITSGCPSPPPPTPQNVSFILYTSGSSSPTPTAVIQTYGGLWNRIRWQWGTFPFVNQMMRQWGLKETRRLLSLDGFVLEDDVVLRRTALSFIDAMAELFGALCAGVALWCPIPSGDRGWSLVELMDMAMRDGVNVTRVTCLPCQLMQLLRMENGSKKTNRLSSCLNVVIVSGEPCPSSLPPLISRLKKKTILVNLYGQTESSGDVSCAIVACGGGTSGDKSSKKDDTNNVVERSIMRFPNAIRYICNHLHQTNGRQQQQHNLNEKDKVAIERWKRLLVPCGHPIDNHRFIITSITKNDDDCNGTITDNTVTNCMGILHITGPGIGHGYLTNHNEAMSRRFYSHDEDRCFNTMDVAFCDNDGMLYVVGRATESDLRDGIMMDDEGMTTTSLTVGKINGVMIHTAEMETMFLSAMTSLLLSSHDTTTAGDTTGSSNNHVVDVIGILYNDVATDDDDNHSSRMTRSVICLDLSTISPPSLLNIHHQSSTTSSPEIIVNHQVFFFAKTKTPLSAHELFIQTRDLMLKSSSKSIISPYQCHPALVPQHMVCLTRLPRHSAAGKIDKRKLVDLIRGRGREREGVVAKCEKGDNETSYDDSDIFLTEIKQIYSTILHQPSIPSYLTFLQLGGDSLQSVNATHCLCNLARSKGILLTWRNTPTVTDLLEGTVSEVFEIMVYGRRKARKRMMSDEGGERVDDDGEERMGVLPSMASVSALSHPTSGMSFSLKPSLAWTIPLLMCIDAPPTILSPSMTIAVGSQGGDLIIVDGSTGRVVTRYYVGGKIEGEVSYLENVLFVNTYHEGGGGRWGCLHAIRFPLALDADDDTINDCDNVSLQPLWKHRVTAELKNQAILFSLSSNQHRIIIGSYDGLITYLNAMDGFVLDTFDTGGGAIHADPVVVVDDDVNDGDDGESSMVVAKALVASSTWMGRVTCLSLKRDGIQGVLWTIDLETPVYATPSLYRHRDDNDAKEAVIIAAIDGSIRCLDIRNGMEYWIRRDVGYRPIFSGGSHVFTILAADQDDECIIFGSHDGYVKCLKVNNGLMKWTFDTQSSPIMGSPLVLERRGVVVVVTSSGRVIILELRSGRERGSRLIEGEMKKEEVKESGRRWFCLNGEVFSSPRSSSSSSSSSGGSSGNNNSDDSIYIGCRDSRLYKLWV